MLCGPRETLVIFVNGFSVHLHGGLDALGGTLAGC
jgi:hypothetical protein